MTTCLTRMSLLQHSPVLRVTKADPDRGIPPGARHWICSLRICDSFVLRRSGAAKSTVVSRTGGRAAPEMDVCAVKLNVG